MSTLRAGTLSNVAGTGSPEITAGELSRARFNLNGTGTIAARDSFNIASFTDFGVGSYTATFSTAFPNANYAGGGSVDLGGVGGAWFDYDAFFIGSVGLYTLNTNGFIDRATVVGVIVGDIP